MSNIIGGIISFCIMSALIPTSWGGCNFFNGDPTINRKNAPEWYKLIYPKWLSLKRRFNYHIRLHGYFRRLQYEQTHLAIKVLWTN